MKNKTAYFFLAATVILFLTDTIQKLPYSPDDTFIYMQYARNIAGGHGFSFNAGEPSYGVTSPFWVILLSIAYFLGINAFWFSKILDIICAAFSVLIFYRLSKKIFIKQESNFFPLLASSLFVMNIWFIRWSFTGMETNLAVLMMLLVLYSYFKKNFALSFFLSGLFFLIRPEGFILFFVLLVCLLTNKNKWSLKNMILYLLLFSLSIIPFLVYAKSALGTYLANTTLGKSTLTLNIHTVTAQFTEIAKTLAPSSAIEILLSVIFVAAAWKNKILKEYLSLVLWPAGLLFLYIVTDADIISRYFIVIIPVFTMMAVKSIEMLKVRFNYSAGIALFILTLLISQFTFYRYVKPHTDNFSKGVEECLIPVGEWFNENTPQDSRILVNDVGAIGYYSDRYIIDAAALINRDLQLNKKIMETPLEERMHPYNLLKFIKADYVVERDAELNDKILTVDGKKLELVFYKLFPGLGISDNTPKYYKVYKVTSY